MFYLFCKHFYLVQSKKSAILHFPQWIICSCNLGVSSFDKNQPKDKLRKGSWTRVFDLKRDSWAFQIHPKACQIYTNLSIFLIIPFWIKISFWKGFSEFSESGSSYSCSTLWHTKQIFRDVFQTRTRNMCCLLAKLIESLLNVHNSICNIISKVLLKQKYISMFTSRQYSCFWTIQWLSHKILHKWQNI